MAVSSNVVKDVALYKKLMTVYLCTFVKNFKKLFLLLSLLVSFVIKWRKLALHVCIFKIKKE